LSSKSSQLQDNGSIKNGEVSASTNQYINQLAVQFKTSTNPDMRRYERPHVNESGAEIPVWDLI
jgi:putative transposase